MTHRVALSLVSAADVRAAARRGIEIMPIASSGLDDQGEYVFRQLAQITMGRFTFLTYGADGASPAVLRRSVTGSAPSAPASYLPGSARTG